MKKIIILALVFASLQAESYYVNVMTSKHKQQLSPISYQLELLGYKRYISHNSQFYILYVGPFLSLENAQNAQANLYTNISLKNTKIVQMKSDEKEVNSYLPISNKITNYFIGVSAGLVNVNSTQDNSNANIALDTKITENGLSVGSELGYYLDENIFMTLNYNFLRLETLNVNNIFMTLNYEFLKEETFSPYVGILGGYSLLNWSEYPIAAIGKDDSSSSFVGGMQMGINIAVIKSIDIYALYQFWLMDHETNLENSQGKMLIKQNFVNNLSAGIKYKF